MPDAGVGDDTPAGVALLSKRAKCTAASPGGRECGQAKGFPQPLPPLRALSPCGSAVPSGKSPLPPTLGVLWITLPMLAGDYGRYDPTCSSLVLLFQPSSSVGELLSLSRWSAAQHELRPDATTCKALPQKGLETEPCQDLGKEALAMFRLEKGGPRCGWRGTIRRALQGWPVEDGGPLFPRAAPPGAVGEAVFQECFRSGCLALAEEEQWATRRPFPTRSLGKGQGKTWALR